MKEANNCIVLWAATGMSLIFAATIIFMFVQFLKMKRKNITQYEMLKAKMNEMEEIFINKVQLVLNAIKQLIK